MPERSVFTKKEARAYESCLYLGLPSNTPRAILYALLRSGIQTREHLYGMSDEQLMRVRMIGSGKRFLMLRELMGRNHA